jgi:hypothetical protein
MFKLSGVSRWNAARYEKNQSGLEAGSIARQIEPDWKWKVVVTFVCMSWYMIVYTCMYRWQYIVTKFIWDLPRTVFFSLRTLGYVGIFHFGFVALSMLHVYFHKATSKHCPQSEIFDILCTQAVQLASGFLPPPNLSSDIRVPDFQISPIS